MLKIVWCEKPAMTRDGSHDELVGLVVKCEAERDETRST